MRCGQILLASVSGLFACSSAIAGFTATATKTDAGIYEIWSIVAINTGGDTGTQIKGLEYNYSGSGVFFQVDDLDENGIADTVAFIPPTTATDKSRLRVNTVASNNTFVGSLPTNDSIEPNPYGVAGGITSFSGAIANTGTTHATGTGFQIARLVTQTSGYFTTSHSAATLAARWGRRFPFPSESTGRNPSTIPRRS
jgi:hypothetical protein